jgi:SAM-dependent methyltransferase
MTTKTAYLRSGEATMSRAAQRGLLQLPNRLEFLTASLPPAPAHVLDVGCAGGYVGVLLTRLGYQVTGIELNATMAAQARRTGIPVLENDLEEPLDLPDDSVDAVHACEIIEHLFDTEGFLREIHRVLRPGGVLVVSSPNLNSLSNRFRVLAGRSLPMWGVSLADHHGGHIRLFNRGSLEGLLRRTGFEPAEARGSHPGRWGRLLSRTPSLSQLVLIKAIAR